MDQIIDLSERTAREQDAFLGIIQSFPTLERNIAREGKVLYAA
jgi:hypothetical protein